MMDGTFGVSDETILLFIVMVLDELWRGVPVAYFLFSAAPGAKLFSSSYDHSILLEFLQDWRNAVTNTHLLDSGSAEPFSPKVSL